MKRTVYLGVVAGALVVAVRTLPAQEARPRLTFQAHPASTRIVGITPDDKLLITRGDDGLKVWDLSTGKERVVPKLTGETLALSPDGKVVALADDRSVRLWDILADKEVAAFKEHAFSVRGVAFSPDGKMVATGGTKPGPKPGIRVAVAALWEVATGKQVCTLESSTGTLSGLVFSPDGKLLAVATQEFPLIGNVTLWDLPTGKVHSTLEANGVDCLAFSPDGKTLAAGCVANYHEGKKEHHHVRLWEVGAAKDLHYLRHECRVYCVAFSSDGKTVASGSDCGELKLWDAATGKERVALPGQPSYVFSVAFSKDAKTLVSTTRDGLVKCWDALKILDGQAEK